MTEAVTENVMYDVVNTIPNVSQDLSTTIDQITYSLFGFHGGKIVTSYLVICGICSIISMFLPPPITMVTDEKKTIFEKIRSGTIYIIFYSIIKFLALNLKYAASLVSPAARPLLSKLINMRDIIINTMKQTGEDGKLYTSSHVNINEIVANLKVKSFDKKGNPIIYDKLLDKSFILTTKSGKRINETSNDDIVLTEIKKDKPIA